MVVFPGPAFLIVFFSLFATSCSAINATFQWQFVNYFSSTLTECQNMSVSVEPLDGAVTTGVPPYYFKAFAVGGIPTVQLAGSNASALSWVVDQPAGSQLMVGMVDSNTTAGGGSGGSSGGLAPMIYNVIPGNDTSCLPPAPTSQFNVKFNVSTTLTTCQPWGMTISGGTQPYTITLAALDSPIITNVTMGLMEDVFTFIDRADPNTKLIAAINDANGQYANGTGMVSTQGSSNVDCIGLVSVSGNSTQMAQEAAQEAAAAAAATSKRNHIIIGVVVGVFALVFLLVASLWFMARKRRRDGRIPVGQDTRPRMFEVEESIPVSSFPFIQPDSRHSSHKTLMTGSPRAAHPSDPQEASSSNSTSAGGISPAHSQDPTNTSPYYTSQFPMNAAAASPDRSSPRRKNKAYMRAARSVGEALSPASPASGVRSQPPNSPGHEPLDTEIEPDIIIQHRDGGVVQELPPPYADRSRR